MKLVFSETLVCFRNARRHGRKRHFEKYETSTDRLRRNKCTDRCFYAGPNSPMSAVIALFECLLTKKPLLFFW